MLPDRPEVRRSLDALTAGELLSVDEVPAPVQPLLQQPPAPLTGKVLVTGFGHANGARMVRHLRSLAQDAGLTLGAHQPDVVVLAGLGEPKRDELDPWVAAGTPHLLVRPVEGRMVVGPFVAPGLTACVRCTDALRAENDPSWPLLVEQYAACASRDRRDGSTEPVDPILTELACAWALGDVTEYLRGGTPTTWSRTLRLGPTVADLEAVDWLRHPACGCSWDSLDRVLAD